MTLYSIYDRRQDEAPAVVPDGFSWFAALLPPVYAVVHGLWLALAGYLIAVVAIVMAAGWLGGAAAAWVYVLLAALFGFEAGNLRRRGLRRRNYVYRAELIAPDDDLAQVEWLRRRSANP